MKKIKLGVIYGGLSTEHEVSINSAKSVIDNLDKDKYDIYKIYIDIAIYMRYNDSILEEVSLIGGAP